MAYILMFLLKKCEYFFCKNTCGLDIVLTRTVNSLTTNKLVKLTMLWTTEPWSFQHKHDQIGIVRNKFHYCGFHRWVNAGESLTNLTQSPLKVILKHLHIDKIHKNESHSYNNIKHSYNNIKLKN